MHHSIGCCSICLTKASRIGLAPEQRSSIVNVKTMFTIRIVTSVALLYATKITSKENEKNVKKYSRSRKNIVQGSTIHVWFLY